MLLPTSTEDALMKQYAVLKKQLKKIESKPPVPKFNLRAKSKLKTRGAVNKTVMKTTASRGMTPFILNTSGVTTDNSKRSSFGSGKR